MGDFSLVSSAPLLLIVLFFIVAFVYASVGFGGGSSYIAILAFFAFEPASIKTIALLCNIVVVTNGTFLFLRKKELDWKKILPLVLLSIPMSYLGAVFKISDKHYFILLGVSLIVAALLLFFQKNSKNETGTTPIHPFLNHKGFGLSLSALIGFLSGMVGIGGGIFLAPLLHLIQWDTARKISAAASFFILVNSISGLLGQSENLYTVDYQFIVPLLLSVFVGGNLGARISFSFFDAVWIKKITAILLFLVAIELLWR